MRKTIGCLTAATMITIVSQQAFADEGNFYTEGGYHIVTVDTEGVDVTVGMVSVAAGYQFSSGFSLEGMVAQGILDDTVTVFFTDVEVGLGTSFGIAAKYAVPVGDKGSIYGKLRYSNFEVEASAPGGPTISESDSEIGFGVGGTYDFSDKTYMVIEYNRFAEDSNAYFFGVGFRF
jgi:hypothetical protein